MILGLDVSSSITGVTILSGEGVILFCDHIDTRNKNKYPTLLDKAKEIKSHLNKISKEYNIEEIYIEESLQSFRSGFSSAKTLSTLAKINGIVSYLCFEIFNTKPEYIGATSARKLCGIKVPKGTKAKEFVIGYLLDNEPTFVVEFTRNGNPKPGYYDRADSIVIARAGLELWKQKKSKS